MYHPFDVSFKPGRVLAKISILSQGLINLAHYGIPHFSPQGTRMINIATDRARISRRPITNSRMRTSEHRLTRLKLPSLAIVLRRDFLGPHTDPEYESTSSFKLLNVTRCRRLESEFVTCFVSRPVDHRAMFCAQRRPMDARHL